MSLKSKFRLILVSILVLLLFSIGIASATLTVKNVISSSGINYRALNDTIGVNVTSSSNVSIIGTPCTKQGTTTYICAVTDIATGSVSAYQLTNLNDETATASINVDNNIGSISYTISTNNSEAFLDYSVQDLGFNNNNLCSGIQSLSVYDGTTILNTVDINGLPGTCTYSGSLNLSIKGSGSKSISVEVTDNVGNKRISPPQNITLDVDDPQIVNGLIVNYAGKDEELSVIGGKASILVDIYFKIREDNLASINLDLSQANTNPVLQFAYKNIDLSLSNCVVNETEKNKIKVHECYIMNVPLQLAGSNLDVVVTATDTFGNSGSSKLTKTFTVDNIEPKVSIKTDNCDKTGKCYIRNGLNNLTLTMNKDNFNKNKFVFLNIPGSTFGINKVQNCSASTCIASVLLTCDSGSKIEVSIASFAGIESQDDAGNIIAPYSTELYCDNNEPVVGTINVTGENADSVIKEIVSGSTIKIIAKITEMESSELIATVQLDKAKNATEKGVCTKISNSDFNCVWTISNINEGYYEANILINATDIIGNSAVGTKKFMVLGFKSDNETPDLIDIRPLKVYPEELNRIVVDMATYNRIPYYIYATYDLSAKDQNDKVSVLHQQTDIGKCNYIGSQGTTSASIVFIEAVLMDPYAGLDKNGKIELKFNDGLDPNALDDKFTISCNISLIVKEGNYIYSKTQEVQLDMKFKAVNSKLCKMGEECTPGEVFGKKIESVENSFWVKFKLMGQIDALVPKLQSMCRMRDYISTASFMNNAVGMAASLFDVGFGGGGGGLSAGIQKQSLNIGIRLETLDQCLFGSRVNNYNYMGNNNGYNSGYNNNNMDRAGGSDVNLQGSRGPDGRSMVNGNIALGGGSQISAQDCSGFIGKMCDKLTCSLTDDINQSIPDMSTMKGVEEFMKRTPKPDVSNSIYQAFKAQCWPAVYYNLNKWRQTDCNYLYCLKIASYTGTDIATCDKTKYAQTCSIIVGEAYAAIPTEYTKYVDNAADFVKAGLPMVVASWSNRLLCPEYVSFETGAQQATFNKQTGESMCGTSVCRASKIMLCQIPLQVARFEDMQTRARQSERFVYPSLPDMCTIANCFGKENCQYQPDIFQTINQMVAPSGMSKMDRDRSKDVALMGTRVDQLRDTRKNLINTYNQENSELLLQQRALELKIAAANTQLTSVKTADQTQKILYDKNKDEELLKQIKTDLDGKRKELNAVDNNIESLKDCMVRPGCNAEQVAKEMGMDVHVTSKTDTVAYEKLPLAGQLKVDQNELKMYQELQQLYKYTENVDPEGITTQEKDAIDKLQKSLNGVSRANIDERIDAQKSLVKTKAKIDHAEGAAQQFGNVLYMGLQYANANQMLNFMNGNNWINTWFKTDITDALDTNKWKESICNPNSAISINGDASEGNVISCEGGLCVPVLTYATERANLEYPNGTKYYIYSVVYYISPGDIRGEEYSYNLYFSGTGVKTMYGFKDDIKLQSYQVNHLQRVFKSPNKYTQVCIKFNEAFPERTLGVAKQEYCREIKESGTWNTGSPYIPPEDEETGNADGSIPEFDADGRRITATTNVNAEQPGVLE